MTPVADQPAVIAGDAPLGLPSHSSALRALRRYLLHDRQSRTVRGLDAPVGDSAAANAWLARARRAAALGDDHAAAHAASEACRRQATAELCGILGDAYARLGRLEDAVVAANRATRLEPHVAAHYLVLGDSCQQLSNWRAAMRAYQTAQRLAPGWDAPRVGVAFTLIQAGAVQQAERILRELYERSANRRRAGNYLGIALVELAERVPAARERDMYFITSDREVARMRELLADADRVAHDPSLRAMIAEVRAYVERCAAHEFRPRVLLPDVASSWVVGTGAAMLVAALAIGGSRFSPWAVAAVLLSVCVAVTGLVRNVRVPRWQLNQRACGSQLVCGAERAGGTRLAGTELAGTELAGTELAGTELAGGAEVADRGAVANGTLASAPRPS
jgi:Flp pilus assembly protein TadD